jgi:hypothetical protein
MEVFPPMHMLAADGCADIATAVHEEETVTVTVNVLPVHEPATGVTVYTAVPEPDGIVRVPEMLVTPVVCATPPVTPLVYVGAGHVYVVPSGTPVGVTVNVPPVAIDAVWLPTTGVGGWASMVTDLPGEVQPAALLAVTV